jgi:hypothetical protein
MLESRFSLSIIGKKLAEGWRGIEILVVFDIGSIGSIFDLICGYNEHPAII